MELRVVGIRRQAHQQQRPVKDQSAAHNLPDGDRAGEKRRKPHAAPAYYGSPFHVGSFDSLSCSDPKLRIPFTPHRGRQRLRGYKAMRTCRPVEHLTAFTAAIFTAAVQIDLIRAAFAVGGNYSAIRAGFKQEGWSRMQTGETRKA